MDGWSLDDVSLIGGPGGVGCEGYRLQVGIGGRVGLGEEGWGTFYDWVLHKA